MLPMASWASTSKRAGAPVWTCDRDTLAGQSDRDPRLAPDEMKPPEPPDAAEQSRQVMETGNTTAWRAATRLERPWQRALSAVGEGGSQPHLQVRFQPAMLPAVRQAAGGRARRRRKRATASSFADIWSTRAPAMVGIGNGLLGHVRLLVVAGQLRTATAAVSSSGWRSRAWRGTRDRFVQLSPLGGLQRVVQISLEEDVPKPKVGEMRLAHFTDVHRRHEMVLPVPALPPSSRNNACTSLPSTFATTSAVNSSPSMHGTSQVARCAGGNQSTRLPMTQLEPRGQLNLGQGRTSRQHPIGILHEGATLHAWFAPVRQ